MSGRREFWIMLHALVMSAAACGDTVGPDGDVVGGPCETNSDCAAESRCHESGAFPGGVCVMDCASHADCPDGSRCISKEGGICVQGCTATDQCRSGYTCTEETAKAGSKSQVCIAG